MKQPQKKRREENYETIDESKARMQNGAKGGRPKKNNEQLQKNRVTEKCDTSARKENGNHS